MCQIPAEVLRDDSLLHIGVFGENSDGVLINTNPVYISVLEGSPIDSEAVPDGYATFTGVAEDEEGYHYISAYVKNNLPEYAFSATSAEYPYLADVSFSPTVKEIGAYAFHNQSKAALDDLKNIEEIGKYAFFECSTIEALKMDKVKQIGDRAFGRCTSLKTLILPEIEAIDGGRAVGTFGNTALETVVLSEKLKKLGTGVERIFADILNLTAIHLPSSVETIGKNTFYNCPNLVNVTVGEGFNVSLNLGTCGNLTIESLENIVGNYADASGQTLAVTPTAYETATATLFTDSELTIAEYASAKGLTIASS